MIQPLAASSMAYAPPPGSRPAIVPEAPPDQVALLAAPGPAEEALSEKRGWGRTAAFVGLGLAALTLAGCGPSVPPISDTITTNLPAAGISVDANHTGDYGVEVLPQGTARIDLHRETRTETDSDGDSHTENVEYSPVGVYLGSGVFLDLNGNLSLIPERAFAETSRGAAASHVDIDGPGIFNRIDVRRDAGGVTVDPSGPGSYRITHEGNRIRVDGPLWADWNISREGDTTRVDLPLWGNFQVTRTENGARVRGPVFLDYAITRQGDQLNVDGPLFNDYTITRQGDALQVSGPAFHRIDVSQHGTTTRQEGRTYAYNVTRDGNEVKVDGPGWDDWNFRVTR